MALLFQVLGAALIALGLGGFSGRILFDRLRNQYPKPVRSSRFHHHDDADF